MINILKYVPQNITIPYESDEFGYGELEIESKIKKDNFIVEIANENLTKDEVKKILLKYVDFLMEHGIFTEFRED